ncbi:cytochrome b5 domain-containing protein [Candidatus Pacearchaeota archaeon]|nr:cytochrome b5 domain-containing protein [Candidatus Pacearchaeota archaeon]
MDRKLKIIIPSLIVVILVAIVVFSVGNDSSTNISNTQNNNPGKQGLSLVGNTTQGQSNQTSSSSSLTLEELSKHNSEADCWVVYQNKVYDLTSWLTKHPGGVNAILPYCGTQEFEAAFKRQHGNSKASLFLKIAQLMGDFKSKSSLV